MDCRSRKSPDHCTCTYTGCEKHGNCCACVTWHRSRQEIPGCFFTPAGERSHDRSLNRFLLDRER